MSKETKNKSQDQKQSDKEKLQSEQECNCQHNKENCCKKNEEKHCHDGKDSCDHEKHCHDGDCKCNHHGEDKENQYQQLFNSLTSALAESEKQLKSVRDEMLNNQRIAVSYKKDLERYKERNKNIEQDAKNNAIENIASNLITILDQFETALQRSAPSQDKVGYQMIYNTLKKTVESLGVSEITALDLDFDSAVHNAISKTKVSDKSKDGKVTAVYQKGYKLTETGKIIRFAMVEVGEYTK